MSEKGIALVTGGARGIGAACSKALAEAGFQVAIHYNGSKGLAEKLAGSLPGEAFTIQADVGKLTDLDGIYDTLKKEQKDRGTSLAVLVNNAGIALDNPIFSAGPEEFQTTMDVNLRSTWYLTKRLSRLMMRKKAGRIINLSSVVAGMGNPAQAIYGMSKAAIENFTRTAAKEFCEYNILVNAVAPGFIQTDMTEKIPEEFRERILSQIPLGRMGQAEEVAQAVLYFATVGSYCTGSVLHINGGMYGG